MSVFDSMDLTVLDQLSALAGQRNVLEQRLETMEARRGEVAPAVYLRVRSDYEAQKSLLVQQEAPLKSRARALFAEVRETLEKIDRSAETARLSLEELEFRFSLGEFEELEFERRKQEIQDALSSGDAEQEQARSVRARFNAALDANDTVESARFVQSEVIRGEATAIVTPISAPPLDKVQAPPIPPATMLGTPLPSFAPIKPDPLPAAQSTPTPIAQMPASAPPLPFDQDRKPPEPVKRANPDATVVFRPGKLIPQNPEAGGQNIGLSLKPITIGSESNNDIVLKHPNLLGKHAEISMSKAGFTLRDVSAGRAAPGIILVNGAPVAEHLLKDGDQIHIANAIFAFKSL